MSTSLRITPLIVALVGLASLFGACGGGDNSNSPSGSPADSSAGSGSAAYTPHSQDEKQAYRAATGLNQVLTTPAADAKDAQRNATAACALMSAKMRSHFVFAAKATGGGERKLSCKIAMAYLIGHSQHHAISSSQGAQVAALKVTAAGTAIATVQDASGKTSHLRLVKEDGHWKVTVPGSPPPVEPLSPGG